MTKSTDEKFRPSVLNGMRVTDVRPLLQEILQRLEALEAKQIKPETACTYEHITGWEEA